MSVQPYYQDDHVTLYHGDCLELADLWTGADVLVTDPPYGIAYTSGRVEGRRRNATGVANDQSPLVRDAALAAWGDRPGLVFGRWDIPRPEATRTRLVWDKNLMGTGDLRSPWGSSDEEIYVIGAWPPVKPGGRARDGGKPTRHSSVIRVQALAPGAADRPNHPTPKPVPLMEALITKCPSGVISDPFAGAGATLVAAKALGRQVIGLELEERYCELIAQRCAQEVLDFSGAA